MERLTNIGSNGEIWITDNDETRRFGRKESAYKKLAEYEDLEEQGLLLLRLPCKVGDTVYRITPNDNYIMKSTVEEFVSTNSIYMIVRDELFNCRRGLPISEIGKTVFLTKEEAEQKLKEMESD